LYPFPISSRENKPTRLKALSFFPKNTIQSPFCPYALDRNYRFFVLLFHSKIGTMKVVLKSLFAFLAIAMFVTLTSMTMDKKKETSAYLEITIDVKPENRMNARGVYVKYKNPFLTRIEGATSKELLIRNEDVQVLHGFDSEENAKAYLKSPLFEQDVVRELKPYMEEAPEVRIYSVFKN